MKKEIKDASSKLMFNILKNYKEKMIIKNVRKLVANLPDKTKYVIYIINSNQALNHGLAFKKQLEQSNLIKILG